MKRPLVVALAIGLMWCGAARAHHSFAATYDETRTIKIEGKLVQFLFRNLTTRGRCNDGRSSGVAPACWARRA